LHTVKYKNNANLQITASEMSISAATSNTHTYTNIRLYRNGTFATIGTVSIGTCVIKVNIQ